MTIPFYCVLAAFVLIYLSKLPAVFALKRLPGGYDNHHGRDQQAKLSGWGRRAIAAHQNGFESFPAFAAAVLIAHVKGANPDHAAALALTYVASRLAYVACYLADRATLRSAVWFVGMLAIGALFLI